MGPASRPTVPSVGQSHPPRQVLLFSGHRIDAPGRTPARFPASNATPAALAIEAALARLDAGAADLALTQGSSGGDLLFAEAVLRRAVPLRLMLSADEHRFIDESVRASANGAEWVERYRAVRASLAEPPQVLPPPAVGAPANRYERCNQWLLDTALAHGAERLRFICLWDGAPGSGPGGTAHLVDEVRRRGLPVIWLDASRL